MYLPVQRWTCHCGRRRYYVQSFGVPGTNGWSGCVTVQLAMNSRVRLATLQLSFRQS